MQKSFWLARILECTLISIPLIIIVNILVDKTFPPIARLMMQGFCFMSFCIFAIVILKSLEQVWKVYNLPLVTKVLRKINIDFYILFVISLTFAVANSVLLLFSKINFLELIKPFFNALIVLFKNFTLEHLISVSILSSLLGLFLFAILFLTLLFSWVITGFSLYIYYSDQMQSQSYQKTFAIPAFYSLQLSKFISWTTSFIGTFYVVSVTTMSLLVPFIIIQIWLKTKISIDFFLAFILIVVLYGVVSLWILALVLLSSIIPYVLGFTISILGNSNLKTSIDKTFSSFAYSYIYNISKIIKYVLPYSFVSIVADPIYILVVRSLLYYSSQSRFIPNSFELRDFTLNFIEKFNFNSWSIKLVFLFSKQNYVDSKLELANGFASQAFLFGDIRISNLVYKSLRDDLFSLKNDSPFLFSKIVTQICDYYIKTSQHSYLKYFWEEIDNNHKDSVLKLSYLTNSMKIKFAIGEYSSDDYLKLSRTTFEKKNSVVIVSESIAVGSNDLNSLLFSVLLGNKINSPQDLFFVWLSFTAMTGISKDLNEIIDLNELSNTTHDNIKINEILNRIIELTNSNSGENDNEINELKKQLNKLRSNQANFKDNSYTYRVAFNEFSNLVRLIFDSQNKIYLSLSTVSNKEESYPDEIENIKALRISYNYKLLGAKILFPNPFSSENIKLVPLILTLKKYSSSLDVLNTLIKTTDNQSRYIELAFLKCCQGRFLFNEGNTEESVNLLKEGLSLYEGIRHSVNTDQLGISIGSNYLQYYDWLIEALIQKGDFEQAFNYVERSSGRALLDLVSGKTFYSNKASERSVQQFISKIQTLSLNIFFLQLEHYQPLSLFRFFPSSFKKQLERNFYTAKSKKIDSLIQERLVFEKALDKANPVAATLVKIKNLSYSDQDKDADIYAINLFQNGAISKDEIVLYFHILYNSKPSSTKRDWDKVIIFGLYLDNNVLHLKHHIVDGIEAVVNLQNSCRGINDDIYQEHRREENYLLDKISKISSNLIKPVLEKIPNSYKAKAILISTKGELQFLPWGIFSESSEQELEEEDYRKLVEQYRLRLTPNLSFLYLLKQREKLQTQKKTSRFLIAGIEQYPNLSDYLFWAGMEITHIAQTYSPESLVLKDQEVDLLFREEFKKSEIIHYSGHATYQESNSIGNSLDKTYLCLYQSNISASQILDGDLENPNAKAMILSACLTGRGDLTISGSEVLGLERALFYAGLSSIVTTLWSVNEFSTAIFMIKFHKIWKSNANTLETLACTLTETQLWLKEVSWKELNEEFPTIEQYVRIGIQTYEILIRRARERNDETTANKFEQSVNYYREIVLSALHSASSDVPFAEPYYWAAFQVKGIG